MSRGGDLARRPLCVRWMNISARLNWRIRPKLSVSRIEQRGDRRDQLWKRERFCDHDAVGDPLGGPVSGTVAAHIDDRHRRNRFANVSTDIPAAGPFAKLDVRDDSSDGVGAGIELLECLGCICCRDDFESSLFERCFDIDQDQRLVFDNKHHRWRNGCVLSPQPTRNSGSGKMFAGRERVSVKFP